MGDRIQLIGDGDVLNNTTSTWVKKARLKKGQAKVRQSRSCKDLFEINILDSKSETFSVSSTIGEYTSSLFEEAIFEHLMVYCVPYIDVKFEFELV